MRRVIELSALHLARCQCSSYFILSEKKTEPSLIPSDNTTKRETSAHQKKRSYSWFYSPILLLIVLLALSPGFQHPAGGTQVMILSFKKRYSHLITYQTFPHPNANFRCHAGNPKATMNLLADVVDNNCQDH